MKQEKRLEQVEKLREAIIKNNHEQAKVFARLLRVELKLPRRQ